ncbi:MAG: hypothetical protein WC799_05475 [Desulfobacteraceae bacterium]|jgi:hypothetical protein
MDDNEFNELIKKYAIFYYKKFKSEYGLHIEYDDMYSNLAIIALEARNSYDKLENKSATLRTFIISAFKKRMINHYGYLKIRQIDHKTVSIIEC